jgi:hypothetical protein
MLLRSHLTDTSFQVDRILSDDLRLNRQINDNGQRHSDAQLGKNVVEGLLAPWNSTTPLGPELHAFGPEMITITTITEGYKSERCVYSTRRKTSQNFIILIL